MLNNSLARPQKIIRKEPLILLVEDNEDNMSYAAAVLELSNYQFLQANNGRVALDIAMDKLPDLILLDIVMPKVDGIEVIETLRRNPLTNHIYIVAVTGLTLPHDVKAIMDAGCDVYLEKPFTIEQLENRISFFLC
ncbi:MAG: response regulator [Cyanobacteria bacterium J06607_15]